MLLAASATLYPFAANALAMESRFLGAPQERVFREKT
jgi:hypothetical protein